MSAEPSASRPEPGLPRVAAFDVDGTLTTEDCVVPFLRRVGGSGGLALGLVRRAPTAVPAALRRDRDRLKAVASEIVFAGRDAAAVDEAGASFALTVLARWIRPDTLAVLRAHQQAGATTALVSASYDVYLRPLAERLGVDWVLCTELERRDGRLTGALVGGNCRAAEKPRRLDAAIAAQFGDRRAVEVWAYGDSAGDRELLAAADHAVWVGDERVATP